MNIIIIKRFLVPFMAVYRTIPILIGHESNVAFTFIWAHTNSIYAFR